MIHCIRRLQKAEHHVHYINVSEARDLPGLRLALTQGVPGPFGMAARAILDLRNVPYHAVAQLVAQPNEDLLAWTGHRNAPVAVYNDEAPRTGWLDIVNLAERLGSGPSLIPTDIRERMLMVALTNEIVGENGLMWNCRILMLGLAGPEKAAEAAKTNPMFNQYGYSRAAADAALPKVLTTLELLTDQLTRQRDAGSPYLIGASLTAADVHWVYFSQLLRAFPAERCPMPDGMRRSYEASSAAAGDFDEILIDHREGIISAYPSLPMDF
jgi:glutathione S-transferase